MVDFTPSMDNLVVAKKGHALATKHRNVTEASIEYQRLGGKGDLIVDVFIDPITERHMSICAVQQYDAMQEAMKRFVGNHNSTNMPTDKKRFRLPSRECMTPSLLNALKQYPASNGVPQQDKRDALEVGVEIDELTYTSKRMKRGNDPHSDDMCLSEEEWNFAPYPSHTELDKALNECGGLSVSQLLATWDQLPSHLFDETEEAFRKNEEFGATHLDDVEHALLDFHVTSGGWTGANVPPPTKATAQHYDDQDLTKYNKVLPSDSSSVSSISFHEEIPPPPLLRVTTSTILEEQELIWKQIKEDRHDDIPDVQSYNLNSVWYHDGVTRGHHMRPPLSPQSRCSILTPKSIPSATPKETDTNRTSLRNETEVSNGPFGRKTPSSGSKRHTAITLDPPSLPSSSSHNSFIVNTPTRTAHMTPSKSDKGYPAQVTPSKDEKSVPKPLAAPCFGCQSQLQLPRSQKSPFVYCVNCGMMASTDLMRSFVYDESEDMNLVSFDGD